MRSIGWKIFAVLAVITMLAGGSVVSATPIAANGTFGYVPIGDTTMTGSTLGSATSVTIPSSEIINTLPSTFLGNPNDFASLLALAQSVTVAPLTLNTQSINGGFNSESHTAYLTFSSGTTPAGRFTFDMSSIKWASSGDNELDFAALGTFHDSQGTYGDQSADISASFTRTTQGGTINASFTFETPATVSDVPEPASLTLLGIGAACLLGYGIRRKTTTVA